MSWLDRLLSEHPLRQFADNHTGQPVGAMDPALDELCIALHMDEALVLREERAGILEYQGGFSRTEAEQRAGLTTPNRTEAA